MIDLNFDKKIFFYTKIGSPSNIRQRNNNGVNNYDDELAPIITNHTSYTDLVEYDTLPQVDNIDSIKVSLARYIYSIFFSNKLDSYLIIIYLNLD